jgi:hypothetical protein
MGPIETLLPRRSSSSKIGESLSAGMGAGLNESLQQMLETKRSERIQSVNAAQNKKAFGNEYGGLDPQIAVKLHELTQEYGAADTAYNARSGLMQKLFGNNQKPPSQLTQRIDGQQPEQTVQPPQQIKQEQPKRPPIEQTRKDIHDYYSEEKKQASKLGNRKLMEQLSKDEKQFIDEANQAEKLFIDREAAEADIAKKRKELGQMTPAIEKQYISSLEQSKIADKTIEGVEQIDQLLKAGAQAPQMVTRINQILGKDSAIAQKISGIAASPLANAVDTAAVQQFGEGKNIFGQMRVTEFNEFIKKLQSVTDPKISNDIKSVILRGYAASDKIPFTALNQAIKELPNGSDQQILERSEELRSKYQKSLQDNNRLALTYLTSPERFQGKSVVVDQQGDYYVIPKEEEGNYLQSRKYRVPDWFLKR